MFQYPEGWSNPLHDFFRQQQLLEKKRLRYDLTYIGVLSLALTLFMEVGFSVIVLALISTGLLTPEQLAQTNLGLDNTSFLLLYSVVYTVSLLIPAVVVSLLFKKRYVPLGPSNSLPYGVTLVSIIAAVGLCMAANIVNSYFMAFFTEVGLSVPEAPKMMEPTWISLVLNLLVMAVLPALLEEMIYRGYILRTLRPYGSVFAVVVSALLFSLMHGNLRQIPFAFIVGLVLGLLYVLTNNIWVSVAVHFINNAISVLMEYLSFDLSENLTGLFYAVIIYGFAFAGVFAGVVWCIGYGKEYKVPKSSTTLSVKSRAGLLVTTPLFLIALIVYFALLMMEI